MKKLRVAFVVQRYGVEVNGGAEAHCRMIAERLARFHDVEVLTTRAIDYVTWQDEYDEGAVTVNDVLVRRFSVDGPRVKELFDHQSGIVFGGPHTLADETEWMKRQGPYSSTLLAYLESNREAYDVFVFFTYLYCTTFFGLPLVRDRAILVPTAHDEPPLYLSIFEKLFSNVRYLMYNTIEERALLERRFCDTHLAGEIVGVGVAQAGELELDLKSLRFAATLRDCEYALYLGRIEESKGCKTLLEYFERYIRETRRKDLKLVMVGKSVMSLPTRPWLMAPGFVSENAKFHAIRGSRFMIAPSPYESLCMSMLEAWSMKRPVLCNGVCSVLRGQCLRSDGGLWYGGYESFRRAADLLLSDAQLSQRLGAQGYEFVQKQYTWEKVDQKYLGVLARIGARRARIGLTV